MDGCQHKYLNFGLEGGRLITLDRTEAELHGPNILRVHAIPCDRLEGDGESGGQRVRNLGLYVIMVGPSSLCTPCLAAVR